MDAKRLTKKELFEMYEEAKKKDIACVVLFIHMPTGETEAITNSNVEEKMKYIDKTYDENLVHSNCKDIFIEEVLFPEESDTFDFGMALDAIKDGSRVSRKGWNGKDQYVRMVDPYMDPAFKLIENVNIDGTLMPFFALKNAQNGFIPWVPSIGDLLAEDWYELEEEMLKDAICESGMEAGMPEMAPETV